ncbi:MAG TPA: cytochrome c oxidase subunit II [Allosphingosinicella sp.]|nr:cytochrome c oxidase subunit II [Allosphingosinicella sp.]
MKTFLTLFAVAAAIGMAPAAALAQQAAAPAAQSATPGAPQPPVAAPAVPAPAAIDPISAASQASPAQPEEVSGGETATSAPSNESVLSSSITRTSPDATVGQPVDGKWGFQPQVTPIGQEAATFHNLILMPLITIISVFVLLLMLYVIIRFRRSANPTPSRTTHHTLLEVLWTLVPVLILVAIAVPSIRLLAHQYSPPKADLTIKVTGNQWYWTYAYPDHGDFELVSNMLSEEDAKKRGEPRLLAVDERVVVPVGATVKLIVTSADVIHSWGIPAFWVKMDAVPGRLNETWFKADRPGVYYGQCFELCGSRHAYMPIAVEVVQPAQFAAWIGSKGGVMPGAGPQLNSGDETATSPITNPGAAPVAPGTGPTPTGGASGATETSPAPTGITPGTGTPPVSTQGSAQSRRGS